MIVALFAAESLVLKNGQLLVERLELDSACKWLKMAPNLETLRNRVETAGSIRCSIAELLGATLQCMASGVQLFGSVYMYMLQDNEYLTLWLGCELGSFLELDMR